MNVLMMVSWYTPMGMPELEAGVFHYEQSMDLSKHCNVAIYYPFDTQIKENETCKDEWGIKTYRSRYYEGITGMHKTAKQIEETFAHIVEDFKPDIIHAHCAYPAGYYAAGLAKKFSIPYVVTEHNPIELSRVDKLGLGHFYSKRAYGNSAANICVSKDSRQKLSAVYPSLDFDVIYNGIIMPDYEKEAHKYYKDGYLNIVIVAVLYDLEIKGLRYLLGAMQILKNKGEKVFLHHIGGGEYLEYFENLAKELDVDDVCKFHGRCERKKLYEIVNEMDFFVSASLLECSGVSVQEAMLLGKPVLGTNSGGVDSLVPEKAGIIVEKKSAEALAQGIEKMKHTLDKYDRKWIREYAESSFEIGNISKQYMKLYNKILEKRND